MFWAGFWEIIIDTQYPPLAEDLSHYIRLLCMLRSMRPNVIEKMSIQIKGTSQLTKHTYIQFFKTFSGPEAIDLGSANSGPIEIERDWFCRD